MQKKQQHHNNANTPSMPPFSCLCSGSSLFFTRFRVWNVGNMTAMNAHACCRGGRVMCEVRHNSGLVSPRVAIQRSNPEPRPATYSHSITVTSCVKEKRLGERQLLRTFSFHLPLRPRLKKEIKIKSKLEKPTDFQNEMIISRF